MFLSSAHRYLYYIDDNVIYRVHSDGSNKENVFNETNALSGIVGLAIDVFHNTLYWTFGNTTKHLNITEWEDEGKDPFTELAVGNAMDFQPHGIAVVNGTIYWSETHGDANGGAICSKDYDKDEPILLFQNDTIRPQDVSTFISETGEFNIILHCCLVFSMR